MSERADAGVRLREAQADLATAKSALEQAVYDLAVAFRRYEDEYGEVPLRKFRSREDPKFARIFGANDQLVRAEAERDAALDRVTAAEVFLHGRSGNK